MASGTSAPYHARSHLWTWLAAIEPVDAQRTLYGAQQGLVATRLAEQANRIALYRALGGGWRAEAGEGEAR